jgi:hypothetical protein
VLDRVYRAVAGQRVDQIRYNTFNFMYKIYDWELTANIYSGQRSVFESCEHCTGWGISELSERLLASGEGLNLMELVN